MGNEPPPRIEPKLHNYDRVIDARTTTGLDPRHDSAFGLALYALEVLSELLRVGTATSVLGRAGLRTILEAFVTLKYLTKQDDPKLWDTYRRYGAGQAKLAFLKLDAGEWAIFCCP